MRVEIDLWRDVPDTIRQDKMRPFKATLVDVLDAWKEHPCSIIQAYYGGPAGEPPPRNATQRFTVTRNVYLKDTGGYVVLPMTERNIKCVKELDE